MRVVLNTTSDTMGAQVCIYDLHRRLTRLGVEAALNDWDHYDRYDVAVFMGYDDDVARARQQNPDIRIAIADPKQNRPEFRRAAREADFLMVSSVEQRDVFYRYNRNILVYYMFPEMEPVEKEHIDNSPIIIGYHGNRVHLECMANGAQLAINELARRREIEFWAMYNVRRLGQAHIGMPDDSLMRVRHIQWSEENYYDELARVDIGVVPNEIPIKEKARMLEASAYPVKEFNYVPYDHLTRYKASSNPGRIYVFGELGIPVVSDFYPSAAQFIIDGRSGFLASSPQGWFEALDRLAESASLRSSCAARLKEICDEVGDPDDQTRQFLRYCGRDIPRCPISFSSFDIGGAVTTTRVAGSVSRIKRLWSRSVGVLASLILSRRRG